jgi:hypothetical protein
MRVELEKHHLFEVLNNEKITPAFVKLAKSNYVEASLNDIVDEHGLDFNSNLERKKYIEKYFADCYRVQENVKSERGCVEKFLGEDICNSPLVRDSKLTVE